MLSSWFGSVSSRRSQSRQTRPYPPPAPDDAQPGPSDVSSVSKSTVGPLQTPGNLTSASDIPLDEVHAHINDPSVYAPTPSLIHSAEKEGGTLGTSDARASLDAGERQHDNTPTTKRVHAPERLERTLFTPQDAIIAQVFGKSVSPAPGSDPARRATPPPSTAPRPSVNVSLMTADSLAPPASSSMRTGRPSSTRRGSRLTIYDPFSGAKLGEHAPSAVTPGELSSTAPHPAADDRRLWSSLERILELQAEIAAMHADMEGVGGRTSGNPHVGGIASVGTGEGANTRPRKRSRRGQTLPVGDEEPEEPEPEGGTTGGAVSEISTDRSDRDDDGDEDEDVDDIHMYGKKRRDEEFARLAEQFAQRKTAIGGIMNKLDDLSMALKTFHTLPPPLFEFAMSPSRTDAIPSAPSSALPFHAYPGRPSSPFSTISPSQVARSATPPTVTLSPPVSSASAVSSGHASTVAPPRVALPRTLAGTAHVESPTDMDPAQSVFHKVPWR